MADAKRDANRVPTLIGVTNDSNLDPILLRVDPATNRLLVTATISSGSGGTQYAIGTAAGATDTGNAVLVIRDDALSTLSDAEGDWVALRVGSTGALWTTVTGDVNVTATNLDIRDLSSVSDSVSVLQATASNLNATVVGTGTFAVQDSQDVMLGTDFSSVLGTASLILATQADDIVNTSDGVQTSAFNYWFDGTTWDRARGDATDGLLVNLGANNDVVVSATDLDIRNLTSTDVVTVTGGAGQTADVKVTLDSEAVTVSGTVTVDTELGTAAAITSDAYFGPSAPNVYSFPMIYLGSGFWSRWQQALHGLNVGLGIAAAGVMAEFDDTSPTTITENNFGTVRMSANRNLYTTLRDAAGNERGVNVTASNELSVLDSNSASILTAVELIDDAVFVDDADWTADTSKHLLVGAVTQVATTVNTDGDTTPLTTNAFRELRTAIPESDLATAGTAHVKKYYTNAGAVTDGIIWSPAAGKRWYVTDIFINVSAAATVTLEDDLGAGDAAVWKAELAANSGWSHSFATPLFSGEDAADLIITTSAGNVYVTCVGYEI